MNNFLSGAITLAYLMAGLYFLRFWKQTRDRLFAMFAASFWVFAVVRILLAITDTNELRTFAYIFRLLAYILIVAAIVDKNRRK